MSRSPKLIRLLAAAVTLTRGARLINWLQDLFPEVAAALGVRIVRGPVAGALRWARNGSLHWASANVVIGRKMGEHLLR